MSNCKIMYNGSTISFRQITPPVSVSYNGNTIATVIDGQTKTLNCSGKKMASNVVVGGKTLLCSGKYMTDNVSVKVGSANTPLCFTALQPNSTVSLTSYGSPTNWSGYYSYDNSTWTVYAYDTAVTLANVGDKVYFKGTITNNGERYKYRYFIVNGYVNVSGNIMSFSDGDNYRNATTINYTYQFQRLFQMCSDIVSVSDLLLPATTLKSNCYYRLFYGCSIQYPPELPATTLVDYCYAYMFESCSSLLVAPALPALTIPNDAYYSMFDSCSSLVIPPELPATSVGVYGYGFMFKQCTSLTTLPKINAISLGDYACQWMFALCINLKLTASQTSTNVHQWRIPYQGSITSLGDNVFSEMFRSVSGAVTVPSVETTYYTNNEPI